MGCSIRDLASSLGVSTCTVSRVLNGTKGFTYSAQTRKRIKETARRMGYVPSPASRAMRLGKTFAVALVTSAGSVSGEYFFAELQLLLYEKLAAFGYDLAIHTPDTFQNRLNHFAKQCDGVIIMEQPTPDCADMIRSAGLPVVEMNTPSESCFDCVRPADLAGGKKLGRYLADLGYQRVVFLGRPDEQHYARQRFEGIRQGLEGADVNLEVGSLSVPRELLRLLRDLPRRQLAKTVFVQQGGHGDLFAVCYMAMSLGMRVPDHFAVASCHVIPEDTAVEEKRLSGTIFSLEEMAERTAEMLLKKIEEPGEKLPSRSVAHRLRACCTNPAGRMRA